MIGNDDFMAAVRVFETYGAAANPSAFNIYKRLIDEVIALTNTNNAEAYPTWASLRNMLLHLVTNLHTQNGDFDPRYVEVILVVNCNRYSTLRWVILGVRSLLDNRALLCVAVGAAQSRRRGAGNEAGGTEIERQSTSSLRSHPGRQSLLRSWRCVQGQSAVLPYPSIFYFKKSLSFLRTLVQSTRVWRSCS
jgi:hypothetical protein